MKIAQYNVLDGCRENARYEKLSEWIKNQQLDCIGFNELNEWTKAEFQQEMELLGFPYTFLYEMKTSPYYLGIASKLPLQLLHTEESPPLHHGFLHVKISSIHFIVIHFSPYESTIREQEAKRLMEYVKAITEPLMIMGDFNSLSPLDKDFYIKQNTREQILTRPFLTRQHIVNGEINFRPMEIFLQSFHDIGFSGKLDYSMPTNIRDHQKNPIYVRIDYMLANSKLKEMNPTARIVRDAFTDVISDHYPIVGTIEGL